MANLIIIISAITDMILSKGNVCGCIKIKYNCLIRVFCNMKTVIFRLGNPILQSIAIQVNRGVFRKIQQINITCFLIKRYAMLQQFVRN